MYQADTSTVLEQMDRLLRAAVANHERAKREGQEANCKPDRPRRRQRCDLTEVRTRRVCLPSPQPTSSNCQPGRDTTSGSASATAWPPRPRKFSFKAAQEEGDRGQEAPRDQEAATPTTGRACRGAQMFTRASARTRSGAPGAETVQCRFTCVVNAWALTSPLKAHTRRCRRRTGPRRPKKEKRKGRRKAKTGKAGLVDTERSA